MDEFTEVLVEAVVQTTDSTLGYGFGRSADGRQLIAFVGDWRPMSLIRDALAEGDTVVALVPEFMVRLRITVSEA